MLGQLILMSYPIGCAYSAYSGTRFKLPTDFDRLPVLNFPAAFNLSEAFNLPETKYLKDVEEKIAPLLEKENVRKDLRIIQKENPHCGRAFGTNFKGFGDAAVELSPFLLEPERENSYMWVTKHEIGHIKNNDLLTIPLVMSISTLAAAALGITAMSFWPGLACVVAVQVVTRSLFSQWREAKADDFANRNSTNEELLGGLDFLRVIQENYQEQRVNFMNKIIFSSSGEHRTDFMHPSLKSRILKIEDILEKRGVAIH